MTITREAALAAARAAAEEVTFPACSECKLELRHIPGTGGCGGSGSLFACIPCDTLYVQMRAGGSPSIENEDLLEWIKPLSQTQWAKWAQECETQ